MTTNESTTNSPAPSVAQTFKPGDKLAGCYTLKQILPFEGAGIVWLVRDEELDKDLTLHFLPDSVVADHAAMEELRQATRRNRQLIHPRILRVHDLIEENNWAAISMDYVEGETVAALQQHKENGAFNVSEITRWVAELCQTLEDAHRVDLLHRDLAPENLLVTKNGVLMVMNFGISRVVLDSIVRSGHKISGEGNLALMSPQQLDGERPSRFDDVYSLGAVIYSLLTGKPPFYTGDLIPQIRKTVPPLISERRVELKIGGEGIPKSWDKTVAACLSKHTEERPKSATEVASKVGADKNAPAVPLAAVTRSQPEAVKSEPAKPAIPKTEPVSEAVAETPKQTPVKQRGPTKAPVIAEATVVSKTSVPKPAEPDAEPEMAATGERVGEERRPGPTTPSGFPLRAFVGVDRGAEATPKSKVPMAALAAAAVVVVIGIAGWLIATAGSKNDEKDTTFQQGVQSNSDQLRTAQNNITPAPRDTRPAPAVSSPTPVQMAANTNKPSPTPAAAAAASPARVATPAPAVSAAPPAAVTAVSPGRTQPPAVGMVNVPAAATAAQAAQIAAEKNKAADQTRQALAALQKTLDDRAKEQQQAEAAAKTAQDAFKQRSTAVADAKKAADDASAQLKQRTEAQQKAEAEAQQAQKIAAEKAQAAADARKAVEEANAAIQKQSALQQQSDSEIKNLQATADQRQRQAADAAKATADLNAKLQEQTRLVKQAEAEAAQAQAAVAQFNEAEKRRVAQEIERQQAEFAKQQQELEARIRQTQEAAARQLEDMRKQAEALQKQREAMRSRLEGGAPPAAESPLPGGSPSAAVSGASPAAVLAIAPQPAASPKAATPTVNVQNAKTRVDQGMVNSLGMKFAPVGDVLFSVWLTRVQDFEAFAKATNFKGTSWRQPGFKQGPDHPVVKVSWNDAAAFCKWLTDKERKEGLLAANQSYRLPTDTEWSRAVELPEETGKTPEARDMDVPDQYPWGTAWPPPQGAGNFTGEETDSDVAIKGYNDGFAWTSPVGSFAPNQAGLYDMGGNVRQWCMDWWNNEQHDKVLRGSSWYNGALKLSLLSSCRNHAPPTSIQDTDGFRVVIGTNEPAPAAAKPRR